MSKNLNWQDAWRAIGPQVYDGADPVVDAIWDVSTIEVVMIDVLDGVRHNLWRHHTELAMHERLNQ